MKHKTLYGLFVVTLFLTSVTSTVRAQATLVPSWVPKTVGDWNLAYNGTFASGALALGNNKMKSNWTQVWFKNTSTILDAVVGVVTIEYTEDFFGKQIQSGWKSLINAWGTIRGLPEFNGTTNWDLFKWLLKEVTGAVSAVFTEESISGATDAVSFNFTSAGYGAFYFLVAYRGTYISMVFALNFPTDFWTWLNAKNYTTMYNNWVKPYADKIATGFSTLLSAFLLLVGNVPELGAADALIEPTGSIVPTQSVETSQQNVNNFAGIYMGLLPGGIPGYPLLLVGIASFFAVLFIVQKKHKTIVA